MAATNMGAENPQPELPEFAPFVSSTGGCIGYSLSASPADLLDEGELRHQALMSVISLGLCAPLHEMNGAMLNGYMQAIQVLAEESHALNQRAFQISLPDV